MRPQPLLSTLLYILLLTACTPTAHQRDAMRQLLDSADQQNRAFIPFTSDSALTRAVRFYDTYGTHNERMRAHYLLGCVYRDLGEAPQALQCYHDAADCADTTAADCDYRLLCRVHGQIADVFKMQKMPYREIDDTQQAIHYAYLAHDTLAALSNMEYLMGTYCVLGNYEKQLLLSSTIYKEYQRLHQPRLAVASLFTLS